MRQAFPKYLLFLAFAGVGSSCSFIIDVDECQGDSDCQPGQTCESSICVSPENSTCSNSRCAAQFGPGFICGPAKTCIDPRTPDCANLIGPVHLDDTVLVASIVPKTAGWESAGLPIEQAVSLAIEEINEGGGMAKGRRLALLACDSAGNKEQGVQVAEHLADVVGVPVVIGPVFSGVFIDVTTRVTAPKGMMSLSPSATSPLITTLDDSGLGWRTCASDALQGEALVALVAKRGWRKVIALGKNEAYGNGLLNSITPLFQTLGNENFYSRNYPDPGDTANPDFAGVVVQALDAIPNPDAILLLGTKETTSLLTEFERALGSANPIQYVFTDGGRVEDLRLVLEADRTLVNRVMGTEPDHRPAVLYPAFAGRFTTKFGAPPGIFAANAYDALYLIAFGITTLPEGTAITGSALAQTMSRLIDGPTYPAGPNIMGQVRDILTAGGTINYNGASGPLDFDLSTGEARANAALWKAQVSTSDRVEFVNSAQYLLQGSRGEWMGLE